MPDRKLNILFSVRPFRGHLHPLIPLARAFTRAGHRVAVATGEDMAPVLTAAGLPWLPAGFNPRELFHEFPDEDCDYGYPAVAAKVTDLLDIAVEMFSPDVVIREPTDLAPAIAAEVVGAVNVIYGIGHFIPARSWHTLRADETLSALRREYDLPEDPHLDRLYQELYLSILPPAFEGVNPLPVPAVQRLRYVPWDGDGATAPAVSVPGAAERPTVLVTLGTVYNTYSALFSKFLEALSTEPINVICTLGDGADAALTQNAPDNVRFEQYLPHSSILPSCQAMLCHAGFNTVLGCLSAGVPLICVPLGSDQEHNARICARTGLGLWLKRDDASVEQIRESVRRVLTEPSFSAKAQAFCDNMRRRPGFPAAIRRIESLVPA
jgi:N-glycosyltransferase